MKTNINITILIACFTLINNTLSAQKTTFSNNKIKTLISKKKEFNKDVKGAYHIQLYNGSEKKAKAVLKKFQKKFYWVKTSLKFESPDWKVKVGNYETKIEADRAINRFRDKFHSSIIVKN